MGVLRLIISILVAFAMFCVVLSTLVLPLPEELALLWAGWMAHGNIPIWAAFLAAFAGVMIGDTVSFLIGRALLPKLLSTHLGRRIVKARCGHRADRSASV